MRYWLVVGALVAAIAGVLWWSINEVSAKVRHHHKHHFRHHIAIKAKNPVPIIVASQFRGSASWYGATFDGRKTACGTRFSRYGLTAAHPSLPCFTIIQVVNLKNGKRVNLTVTDRGPYSHGRILDVSESAAKILGFREAGTAIVDVQRLSK